METPFQTRRVSRVPGQVLDRRRGLRLLWLSNHSRTENPLEAEVTERFLALRSGIRQCYNHRPT